ncbi:hypothetical protein F2P81_022658 [Scophthalmus maximus]|uniref:Uncharacterized protein n=1 Tax=Scophthalmus maximus TaxID=52904 RepID=A0A6A4RYS5_SCOMX|nr:hypothetical protein F2P81_022658 [Scophthalmus maximus]
MGNGGAKREQKRGTENEEESDEVPRGVQWEDGRVSSLAFVLEAEAEARRTTQRRRPGEIINHTQTRPVRPPQKKKKKKKKAGCDNGANYPNNPHKGAGESPPLLQSENNDYRHGTSVCYLSLLLRTWTCTRRRVIVAFLGVGVTRRFDATSSHRADERSGANVFYDSTVNPSGPGQTLAWQRSRMTDAGRAVFTRFRSCWTSERVLLLSVHYAQRGKTLERCSHVPRRLSDTPTASAQHRTSCFPQTVERLERKSRVGFSPRRAEADVVPGVSVVTHLED